MYAQRFSFNSPDQGIQVSQWCGRRASSCFKFNFRFEGRATMLIKKDSPLNACYTFTLSGSLERQQHLQQGKFFQCRCERCLDPTELGTNFSTLKCQNCHSGDVISSDPLSNLIENIFHQREIFILLFLLRKIRKRFGNATSARSRTQ